jgi:hypothetical protein
MNQDAASGMSLQLYAENAAKTFPVVNIDSVPWITTVRLSEAGVNVTDVDAWA